MREVPGPYATVPRMLPATIEADVATYEPGDFNAKCDMPWKCMCTDCVADRNAPHAELRTRTGQRARRVRRLNLEHRHRTRRQNHGARCG